MHIDFRQKSRGDIIDARTIKDQVAVSAKVHGRRGVIDHRSGDGFAGITIELRTPSYIHIIGENIISRSRYRVNSPGSDHSLFATFTQVGGIQGEIRETYRQAKESGIILSMDPDWKPQSPKPAPKAKSPAIFRFLWKCPTKRGYRLYRLLQVILFQYTLACSHSGTHASTWYS